MGVNDEVSRRHQPKMCVPVCVCVCACLFLSVCIYVSVSICVSVCGWECMRLCLRVYVCVCVRACVFSSKCLNVCMGKRKRDGEGSEHFLLEEIFFSQQTFKFKFFKRLALPQKSQQYQNG